MWCSASEGSTVNLVMSSLRKASGMTCDAKLRLLEQRGEKVAAENFEYSIENEELNKKLQNSLGSQKVLEKELSQLKVENQWLASSQKKASSIEGKMEESAREIQELRRELQEEKVKVR